MGAHVTHVATHGHMLVAFRVTITPTGYSEDDSYGRYVLDKLAPVSKNRMQYTCPICLEQMEGLLDYGVSKLLLPMPAVKIICDFLNDPKVCENRELPCGHFFHAACIEEWLLPRFMSDECLNCPVCRSELKYDKLEEDLD